MTKLLCQDSAVFEIHTKHTLGSYSLLSPSTRVLEGLFQDSSLIAALGESGTSNSKASEKLYVGVQEVNTNFQSSLLGGVN